jgi:hypothetical protein
LWLELQVDDAAPVAFLANLRRQDLIDAGYGGGTFAFELRFPQPLDPMMPHHLVVRSRQTGESLPNMPAILAAAPMSSPLQRAKFEAAIAAEIAAASEASAVDETIGYLLRQVDKLLQGRSEVVNGTASLQRFRLRWNDYLAGERAMPLQPDARPWALVIDTDLPETAQQLSVVKAIQALGYRVAVVATRSLQSEGVVAHSLAAMDVSVLGEPQYFTVEDILRRNRALFRGIILTTPMLAAGYGVMARLHQPRAKVIALLGDGEGEAARNDQPLVISASLIAEFLIVESEAFQATLAQRLPGRRVDLIRDLADQAETGAALAAMLPKLRISLPHPLTNPPVAPDPS